MRRHQFASTTALVLLLVLAAGQTRPQEAPWQTWLVRVEHVHRCDLLPDDAKRLEALSAKVEAAETAHEKRAAQRRLEREREKAEARVGYLLYGWSMRADGQARPVTNSSAMAAFFIPGGRDADRLLRSMQPGDCVAIDRRGAADLFTFSGRRFVRAKRGVAVQCDDNLKSKSFSLPPEPREEMQNAIDVKLSYSKTEPHNENTRHRYSLRVQASGDVTKGSELKLWLHVRFVGSDNQVYGPIIETVDVPRSPSSRDFDVTRGFEIITRPGFDLDEQRTTVELISAR
jgi:hypothetical protein